MESEMIECEHCKKTYKMRGIKKHIEHCKIKKEKERTIELTMLLEARGCKLRSDSRLCQEYITHGNYNPVAIVNIMVEMAFYYDHTSYLIDYEDEKYNCLEYRGRYDPDEVSESAKSRALCTWCEQFIKYDDVDKNLLPESLYDSVRKIIDNRTKKERARVCKQIQNNVKLLN